MTGDKAPSKQGELERLREENQQLHERVAELEEENRKLQRKTTELERLIERRMTTPHHLAATEDTAEPGPSGLRRRRLG